MVFVATASLLILAVAVLALLTVLVRISGNAGPLTLEDYARRNAVVLVPISEQLARELEKNWSQPLRMRLQRHARQPLLGELICTNDLEEPPTHD